MIQSKETQKLIERKRNQAEQERGLKDTIEQSKREIKVKIEKRNRSQNRKEKQKSKQSPKKNMQEKRPLYHIEAKNLHVYINDILINGFQK